MLLSLLIACAPTAPERTTKPAADADSGTPLPGDTAGDTGDTGGADDSDPYVHPLAAEECDAIDNNCDGEVDAPECEESLGLASSVVFGGADGVEIGGTVDLPGDVDGDGYGDLALLGDQLVFVTIPAGADHHDEPEYGRGAVYLIPF